MTRGIAAGAAAGIVAGITSTLAQGMLWWLSGAPLPDILFRDARMAAALVMGSAVLTPPASFDPVVFAVATGVHFALSIGFGVTQAMLMRFLDVRPTLAAGAAFGLLLFGVNMCGFTAIFPWFAASRDWITATAHAVFGMTVSAILPRWPTWVKQTQGDVSRIGRDSCE